MSPPVAKSNKRGWQLNIAVIDSGAKPVTFVRMDRDRLNRNLRTQRRAPRQRNVCLAARAHQP
jgi:uncharacterized protein GlcG (DUF336 family)